MWAKRSIFNSVSMNEVTFKPRSFAGSVLEIFLSIVWIADEINGFCHACENNGTLGRIIVNVKSPLVNKNIIVQYQTKAFTSAIIKSI